MTTKKITDPMDNRAVWEGLGFARFKNKDKSNYRFMIFSTVVTVDLLEWTKQLKKMLKHGTKS